MDLTSKDVPGKVAAKALDRAGIVVNYNTVPYDPRKPFDPSGVRIGTPSLTSRGLTAEQMPAVAAWIDRGVTAAGAGRRGRPGRDPRRGRRPDGRLPGPRPAGLAHPGSAAPPGLADRLAVHPGARAVSGWPAGAGEGLEVRQRS